MALLLHQVNLIGFELKGFGGRGGRGEGGYSNSYVTKLCSGRPRSHSVCKCMIACLALKSKAHKCKYEYPRVNKR